MSSVHATAAALLLTLCALVTAYSDDPPPGPIRRDVGPWPSAPRVGEQVPDFTLTPITGEPRSLSTSTGTPGLVIAIRDVYCPLSAKTGPKIAALEDDYRKRGWRFLYLNVSSHNPPDEMGEEAKRLGLDGAYVHEPKSPLAHFLDTRTTTEVFVLDTRRTLRYRGAIDDQHGIGFSRTKPRTNYLVEALDAIGRGEPVSIAATTAPGCELRVPTVATKRPDATYHNRISRILERACVECHREGAGSPPPLETYEQVVGTRAMVRQVVSDRTMPPWFAKEGSGPWHNPHPLSEKDRRAIIEWIEGGAPEGDASDAPLPRTWSKGWSLGQPDVVVGKSRSESVPAEGVLDYRVHFLECPNDQARWVDAIEIRPSHPAVVHHVLVFVEEPRRAGESREAYRARAALGLDGFFASLVPGQGATEFARGMAKRLPRNAWLKVQVHYQPNGRAVDSTIEIGFHFAKGAPKHRLTTASARNTSFEIPAGAKSHQVRASYTFAEQSRLVAFMPHMHLRGRAFRFELERPGEERTTVLDIPSYDFNWQLRYALVEPIAVPRGSRLHATAWYDNSAENPANPDPSLRVRFGEQTADEMMIGYFDYFTEAE